MNKIDWGFWIIIGMLVTFLVAGIFTSGCAILQPGKSKPVDVSPPVETLIKPAIQLWYAAKASNWLVTMSILGIAGGVFATLNGQKWGMAVIVSCSVALFMSLAVARFAWWMAICGLVGSAGLCVVSILARKRALVEIIRGEEAFKKEMISTDPTANRINIRDTLKIHQKNQQSKSTEKIVRKIKGEI